MKRIVYILVAISLLVGSMEIAGSGGGKLSPPPTPGEGGSAQTGNLKVTLDDAFWFSGSEEGRVNPSWESNSLEFWYQLYFHVYLTVKNIGSDKDGFSNDDVYIITPSGKIYQAGGEKGEYQEFKPGEIRKLVYGFSFTPYALLYDIDSEQEAMQITKEAILKMKDAAGLKLVVGRAEFKLSKLGTFDLLEGEEAENRARQHFPELFPD